MSFFDPSNLMESIRTPAHGKTSESDVRNAKMREGIKLMHELIMLKANQISIKTSDIMIDNRTLIKKKT